MTKQPSVPLILFGWFLMLCFVIVFTMLLAQNVHCQVTWSGPRQTSAELAAVLRACTGCTSNVEAWPAPLPEGPTVTIVGSEPGALGWLTFPRPGPWIRLDGSPAWLPPVQYGSPFWSTGSHFRPSHGGELIAHPPHLRLDGGVGPLAPRLR